jgi:hypothetical protein
LGQDNYNSKQYISITLAAVTAAAAEALAKASFLACFFLNDSGTDDILYNTN